LPIANWEGNSLPIANFLLPIGMQGIGVPVPPIGNRQLAIGNALQLFWRACAAKIRRPMQQAAVLERSGLSVSVKGAERVFPGGVTALQAVDLEVGPGEFVAVLGPSGCGKSTLLRLVAGLDFPTGGNVAVSGSAKPRAADLAYVFQDAHLLPWRNVLRNVALPLELRGVSRKLRNQHALEIIEQVGLTDAVDRYPTQLSGGMRMRVSLARALVTQPRLLLLDEPFAALDEITRQRLDEQLRQLWIDRRMTVIFVTHSTAEAVFLADRAIVMSKRPGQVILDQPIELPIQRTGDLRATAEFAGQTRGLYQALERGGA
jgi:NitT/TauT family transport system ATP-binding protein